jgi:hypothetical protein
VRSTATSIAAGTTMDNSKEIQEGFMKDAGISDLMR